MLRFSQSFIASRLCVLFVIICMSMSMLPAPQVSANKLTNNIRDLQQPQDECGQWNWEGPWNDKDLRIETSPITKPEEKATGQACHGAFRLKNQTATYGGY